MKDNIHEVRAVTYEGFVTEVIEGHDDESLRQFIRHLEAYEVDTQGEWRVSWPTPGGPWFVADGLSERAARIVERLLNDSRFMPSVTQGLGHTPVEGAVAEASRPKRPVGEDWNFNLSSLVGASDRKTDGPVSVWMRLSPKAQADRARVYEDQHDPCIRTVFVDSVDGTSVAWGQSILAIQDETPRAYLHARAPVPVARGARDGLSTIGYQTSGASRRASRRRVDAALRPAADAATRPTVAPERGSPRRRPMARPAEVPTTVAVADTADAWLLDLPQR